MRWSPRYSRSSFESEQAPRQAVRQRRVARSRQPARRRRSRRVRRHRPSRAASARRRARAASGRRRRQAAPRRSGRRIMPRSVPSAAAPPTIRSAVSSATVSTAKTASAIENVPVSWSCPRACAPVGSAASWKIALSPSRRRKKSAFDGVGSSATISSGILRFWNASTASVRRVRSVGSSARSLISITELFFACCSSSIRNASSKPVRDLRARRRTTDPTASARAAGPARRPSSSPARRSGAAASARTPPCPAGTPRRRRPRTARDPSRLCVAAIVASVCSMRK